MKQRGNPTSSTAALLEHVTVSLSHWPIWRASTSANCNIDCNIRSETGNRCFEAESPHVWAENEAVFEGKAPGGYRHPPAPRSPAEESLFGRGEFGAGSGKYSPAVGAQLHDVPARHPGDNPVDLGRQRFEGSRFFVVIFPLVIGAGRIMGH
jgi:hypothetical protein